MGLGDGPRWQEEFEWLRLADVVDEVLPSQAPRPRGSAGGRVLAPASDTALAAADLVEALCEQVEEARVWAGAGARLLLVDLDNLRAGPTRWRARMAVVVALARGADRVALAGQVGAVERALPHLAEFADLAEAVPDGSDLADHALLDSAHAYAGDLDADGDRGPVQVVVASNDGIFAELAEDGWVLTVLSPGHEALSDRLRDAARRTVDLTDAERAATRRWRSRALRAAAGTGRRGGSGRAARQGGQTGQGGRTAQQGQGAARGQGGQGREATTTPAARSTAKRRARARRG